MTIRLADPTLNHPKMGDLCARLDAQPPIEVPRTRMRPQGLCYWNVEEQVRRFGGEVVTGWLILDVPGLYLFAWHHGIWRGPEGNLMDITQPPAPDFTAPVSLFCIDNHQITDFTYPPAILQVYQPIDNDPLVAKFLNEDLERQRLEKLNSDEMRSLRWAYHPYGIGWAQGNLTDTLWARTQEAGLRKAERDSLLPALIAKQQAWLGRQGPVA